MSEKANKAKSAPVKEEQQPYAEANASEPEFMGMEYERYEIIEGVRYDCSPAPAVLHQRISSALHIMLHNSCHGDGTVLYAPIDVYLDEDNQFQPDLVYITHEREYIIGEKRIEGAPDLVVEILSPSTSQNDKIRKKRQYERHGVQEYWIIDPVHRTVDQFVLEQGKFVLYEIYGIAQTLTSPRYPCILIHVGQLFPTR